MKVLQLVEFFFLLSTAMMLAGCKSDSSSPTDTSPPAELANTFETNIFMS